MTTKSPWCCAALAALIGLTAIQAAQSAEKAGALKIVHSPVAWAIKGQPLTLRARVSAGVGGVDSVTLYYALFRDAAPFRVSMTSSGMDMYVGTIEAGLLSGLTSISYYIEAQDRDGSIEETKWYDVVFRDPDAGVVPASRPGGGAAGAAPRDRDEEGMSALTIGLIAGGAVALGAGAYFLADSGGSSGGSDTPTNGVSNNAGTYTGNATICRAIGETPVTCENRSGVNIVIDANGRVFSSTLVSGQSMSATMSGNDFTLSTPVSNSEENYTGNIVFNGTVVGGQRVVGSVFGTIDQAGVPGTFSGTFTLNK